MEWLYEACKEWIERPKEYYIGGLRWKHRRFLKKQAKKIYTIDGRCKLPYMLQGENIVVYGIKCKKVK